MEAFAKRQHVQTTWSKVVVHLEHGSTIITPTDLVLEHGGQAAQKIRGVKINLSNRYGRDEIYLDEDAIQRTSQALEEIANAVARHGVPGSNGHGSKEFWPPYDCRGTKYHELNADVCGDVLVLHGRAKAESFAFPGENPSRLAGLLNDAMNELKQH
jgi:hypothetical protein